MNYKSKRWRQKREKILKRDHYLCQINLRYGRFRNADTVHHILPAEYFPQYEWKDWNLISVSTEAHNTLHDRETHKLTAEGMKLAERTLRRHGMEQDLPAGEWDILMQAGH